MEISLAFNNEHTGTLQHTGNYSRQTIQVPGKAGNLKISFAVPILDMHGYWIPENRTPSTKIHWVITADSAAQRSFPFMAFFNAGQLNRLSVGTTNLVNDTRITAKMNQEKCTYDLTIEISLTGDSENFDLIIDQKEQIWTRSLADWRQAAGGKLPEFPAGAWEPVYCTWYAVHAAVTQNWVEQNAEIAAALGFKTLIIDDGWCFDQMKRVSPETIGSWYELIGDWEMSKVKFPDFDSHRRRVQAMGMKYLLWVTPFLIGNKSEIYQEIQATLNPEYHEGCHVFNSKHRDAAAKIIAKLRHVIEDYQLDGLKVDFLDYILPDIEDPQGNHTMEFIRELSKNIREVNPQALIEFRQSYATVQMLPYGTQFRAGDVPFDFIDNFQRLCQIRIGIGDKVPVHADPAYWHPQESAENIARHMIASLVGVPMLSMDMTKLSELESTIIRYWLDFYRDHRETLNFGKWDIAYHQSGVTYAMCSTPEETVIIQHDSARLSEALGKASGKVLVCNLSPDALVLENAECFTPDGKKAAAGIIPAGGLGIR